MFSPIDARGHSISYSLIALLPYSPPPMPDLHLLLNLDTWVELMLAISLSAASGFRVFVPIASAERFGGAGAF
jgi:hypothetical protein